MNTINTYKKQYDLSSKENIRSQSNNDMTQSNNIKSLKKWHIVLIFIGIFIIVSLAIFIFIKIFKPQKKKKTPISQVDRNESTIKNNLSKEEALKAFTPNFKVASKTNNLYQVLMKSNLKHTSISNGVESTSLSIFTKTIFDIYTLNESLVEEDCKDFYSNKYFTVITINRMCTVFYSNKTDCELEQYLDLTVKSNNLRRNDEEEDLEIIKDAILPICIIEHTDTNIIISVTCPETLSSNLKDDIILSFQSIKPQTFQGIVNDNSVVSTNITQKDNRKYIDTNNKVCDDYNGDPSINETCEEIKNIVTDLDGNLISMKQNSTKEIIKDINHKTNKIKTYHIEDISNSKNFDSNNYKQNLDNVFKLIKPYMKREEYFSSNSFNEVLEELMKGDSNDTNVLRDLNEESVSNSGIYEGEIFGKDIYGINIKLNERNDIGLDYRANAKIISNFVAGEKSKELSHNESYINLNETLNQFITSTNAAKVLARLLQEELNEQLLAIRTNIDSSINDLNSRLSFEDLSPIFDSTLSISGVSKIPYTLVSSSENLISYLNKINNDIPYSINDYNNNLKQALSSYLIESHQLLYYIFSNLTETSRLLSSKKSKIAEISSYYLNNTDTSFVDVIQKAKEVMSNYYINEKKLVKPLVDKMLNEFYEQSIISAEKVQTSLDILVEKLDDGTITINKGDEKDVKNVIDNIYNSKMKVKEILSNIVDKLNKSLGYQDNGFFESQKELDNNNKSYSEISSDSIKIAYNLDNNLLIDTTYDKIMEYFRDQLVVLLNYMEISKREKFPLKENVLENSTFTKENMDKIEQAFKNDISQILSFVKNENNEYLKFVKESLDNYLIENQQNLEKYISDIQVELSDLSLDNLNSKYNETLDFIMDQINKIINDNNDLAVEYLTIVINTGTTHCTQGFKNKYNTYLNNLYEIRNYVKIHLKNNLVNKYKNIIVQIRSLLQKIKSNSIIEKYKNHLSFSEAHLRIIDNLFTRFDKYISDHLFNKNYLQKINDYIQNTTNNLDNLENNLDNLYKIIKKFPDKDSNNDYIKKEQDVWRCCKTRFIGICFKHGNCFSDKYSGYNINVTDNHLNLKAINFSQYTINFDNYYSSMYNQFSNNINNYSNSTNKLSTLFDSKKNELLSKNVDYLSSFSSNVESILNNYLGFNLLTESYNYYKNELERKIPNELDDILSKWNEVYDKVDEDLNSNLTKFKSNILEFGLLGNFYSQTYRSNISDDYVDSIVQERKNDLNYTIKFYYNMISFQVNKTYSYIMNNIPINDKPFDELLNTRILQIKKIYNNITAKIQTSRNQILSGKTQLKLLKLNEENFFLINNYINDNIDKFDEEISLRNGKLLETCYNIDIDDTEENVIAKFYIENSQNGKQIKKINEPINKATFTDLKTDTYQNLLEEVFEIEKDELIKNIQNSLKESNEKLIQKYKYEKDVYSTIIQNKIYKEYYTKENLEKKINELYNNGLKELDEQSKNITYEYLDQVLDNIKEHVKNETARLNNEMTSYSNNYTVIEATLNKYKEIIYNEFYSTIVSVVKDFYNQMKDKFYTNYIEKYLEELIGNTQKENFGEYSFLNITFNLTETVEETVKLLVNEYRNLSMSQIEYLYNKNIQNLDLLFSFSSIKDKINEEISNIYSSVLLPALKVYAKYNHGDVGVLDYDFSDNILNNIDLILNTNIEKTKEIINEAQGNKYIIEEDWDIPSFSLLKKEEFKNITERFNNFKSAYSNQEIEQIKDVISENLKNNFNLFINNFIPSFGIDHFNRILKYNEIQKIKSLYSNLKYSLSITLIYYYSLCSIHPQILFPDNLKYKILTLNDMESTIRSNNDKILSSIDSTFDEFIEDTTNYIVEKYISEIKTDPFINEAFKNSKIILYIKQNLDGKRYIFENEYKGKMNYYIKNPFIQEYSKTLNKETNEVLDFVEKNKDSIKPELNEIFTLSPDDVLSQIENKLNNTLNAIKVYNLHFNSFNIPDNVKEFLDQYIQKEISPKYEEINTILNAASKDLIINNLESNSEKFKNSYNYEEFESKNKEFNGNLTNSFNKINESLKSYGTIDIVYSEKLEKEISKSNRIRNLDELDNDRIAYNRRIANVELNEILQEIQNSSVNIKQFIESLNLFKEFDEKINKYINDINYQYGISQNNIKKNKDYYDELNDKLYELKEYSLQYYKNVNDSYHKTKEEINESIHKMNELIDNCSNITFQTLIKKYIEIKNNSKITDDVTNNTNNEEETIVNKQEIDNKVYQIELNIKQFTFDNIIYLDVIFEDGDYKKPKIVGSLINRNRPKNWEIDISSENGQKGKYGRKITSTFNNISLSVDFNFDVSANKGSFNINIDFDEYIIKNYFYVIKETKKVKEIGGIQFSIDSRSSKEEEIKPEGEKEEETISAKKNEFSIPYEVKN